MGRTDTMAPTLTAGQYDLVYNMASLGMASMGASTAFFFLRLSSFAERHKAALCFTGLVTFIAMYHYFRIFNSFVEAYTPCEIVDGVINPYKCDADTYGWQPTGHPFNDAYRYVDWLLTVPLLLIEIVLVMKLSETETFQRCLTLGLSSALMIDNGYPGEVSSEPLTLGLLVPVHGALRVHRLHPFRGPQGLPGCSAGGCQGPSPMGMLGNRDLVVHVPHRLHSPHAHGQQKRQVWPLRQRHGGCPGGLHFLRHHLQVRCGLPRLPYRPGQEHDRAC